MKKISIVIARRHATSLTLENEFYDRLRYLATEQNMTLNALMTQIDAGRSPEHNLSSAVRVYILRDLLERLNASKTICSEQPKA